MSRPKRAPKYKRRRGKHLSPVEFTKNWIDSIPKIIDFNGCWISTRWESQSNGYILISSKLEKYLLHRIVMCVYYNINYDNKEIVTRHNTGCSRACFRP